MAVITAMFRLAQIYKDKPFFKFIKQNRGILLLSYSVITLLGFGIAQGFGRLFPPFIYTISSVYVAWRFLHA